MKRNGRGTKGTAPHAHLTESAVDPSVPLSVLAQLVDEAAGDLDLQLEDRGWVNLSLISSDAIMSPAQRVAVVKLARSYYQRDR